VNNVGGSPPLSDAALQVNLMSAVRVDRTFLPAMVRGAPTQQHADRSA